MIQVLTYSGKEKNLNGDNVTLNKLHDAQSLDEFDINVIDLKDSCVWQCEGMHGDHINIRNDFLSLSAMIKNSKKSKIVILFPQNIKYKYSQSARGGYYHGQELKDMIKNMIGFISDLYSNVKVLSVLYENTKTIIGHNEVLASFYFGEVATDICTKSVGSNKLTTVSDERVILSTLNIISYEQLIDFLCKIHLIEEKEKVPAWLKEETMFDDEKQLNIIQEKTSIIKYANDDIEKAMDSIRKNERYKSILYTSGDELVDVIFEIIEKMIGCDLSSFNDEKKEDFNFKIDEKVFIGEIKGISTNVKKGNIAQLDQHVQDYSDSHEDIFAKDIVPLLIINHQRTRPLINREEVNKAVIGVAKRNGSLIVETITLLKMFEKFISKEMTSEQCIELLNTNTGILVI